MYVLNMAFNTIDVKKRNGKERVGFPAVGTYLWKDNISESIMWSYVSIFGNCT